MAGDYRSTMPIHVPTIRFPAGHLWIGVNGVYHHHFPSIAIRMHVHGPALKAYILKKTGWTNDEFLSIEWETYDIVLKDLSFVQRVNWIKLAHDWQHTGHQKCSIIMTKPVGSVPSCVAKKKHRCTTAVAPPTLPLPERNFTLIPFRINSKQFEHAQR
jgi:hypothetical protein